MNPIAIVDQLSHLIKNHGLSFHVENEWVIPNGDLPAIRATWYPREENGLLEIDVLIEDSVILTECFAGIGKEEVALNDALQNFMVNSLHVLLAAFWGESDPDQVTTEDWIFGGKTYRAFIGNLGTRGSNGICPELPSELFPIIENTIKSLSLSNRYHWTRNFFCNLNGEQTFESLLDNEVCESGVNSLKTLPWKKTEGYYSVRNFIVLKKIA